MSIYCINLSLTSTHARTQAKRYHEMHPTKYPPKKYPPTKSLLTDLNFWISAIELSTEEHHSSISETAWDNYQEKYNSENYSEGFDSDAARRLLEFGDDYRWVPETRRRAKKSWTSTIYSLPIKYNLYLFIIFFFCGLQQFHWLAVGLLQFAVGGQQFGFVFAAAHGLAAAARAEGPTHHPGDDQQQRGPRPSPARPRAAVRATPQDARSATQVVSR